MVGGYLLSGLAGVVVAAPSWWPAGVPAGAAYVAALGCWLWVLAREPAPAAAALLLAATLAGGMAAHWLVPYSGITLLYATVWLGPFRARVWQAALLTVAAIAGFAAVSWQLGLPPGATFGIPSGLPWALAFAVILRALAETRRSSAAAARARAREAVLGERQRLAREVHDILAHSLSAQTLHLEAARLLLEQGGDRGLALERVTRAGELARSGLAETRRAVEALRGAQAPLREQLERLAEEFRAASGAPCEVKISGDPDTLPPESGLAVARTVQEALANVHKHAPGASVEIGLRDTGSWWELRVHDRGGEAGELAGTGGGYGLAGLRERAELLGGELEAEADGTGFALRLRVPA